MHFTSTAAGLKKLQAYLQREGCPLWQEDNSAVIGIRRRQDGGMPKTDEMDARILTRIGYLHEMWGRV